MSKTLRAALAYALVAAVLTWPLVSHLRSLWGAADPAGDPSLNLWALGWNLQTMSAHPSWLLNGRIFDANIFFPARHTLAYSDHLLLQSVALWPIYALTHDLVLCYNVLLLASLVAAALAMHLLARALFDSERGAYVAGLIFGFAPYHFGHLTHLQLQALYFLPLSLLFVHRLVTADRRLDTVMCGLMVGLQAVSSAYYGVIGGLGVAFAGVMTALLSDRALNGRLLRRALAAAMLALLVALPWSIPYVRVSRETGGGRNLYEATQGSAVLASYLQAPPENLLYGRTGWLRPSPTARLPRKDGPEQALFPGFCALALALLGAATAPRGRRRVAAVYLALAATGLVLSLGPGGIRVIYSGLYHALFGMAAIRAPARFSVLTLCSLAVLAALAIRTLELRYPRLQRPVWIAAVALILLESSNGVLALPQAPVLTTNAGRWLRASSGTGAVLCVPVGLFTGNTGCMLQSLEHGRRIVNGQSGVRPPFYEALADTLGRMPSPESLLAIHELGVEYVVANQALPANPGLGDVLVERARFDDQRVYQVQWSPEAEAAVTAATDIHPPEPGVPPFTVGETARYRVRWTSGPMTIPAGEATIAVAAPVGSEAFRFVVSAKTAPWVARFYEADARLESATTAVLLPLTYREGITEGTRTIDRRLVFDAGRRQVQITSGGTSIALPFSPQARDPISAFFYLRALPLATLSHVRLPISDNGRRLTLDVQVGAVAPLLLDGRTWSARMLESRIQDRIDRPDAVSIAMWLSADARQVPLLVDVNAGFGSVRVELADYRER